MKAVIGNPRSLFLAAALAALALAGCDRQPGETATAATSPAADSGGSQKGDFGPPQGPEIKAVVTSPPMTTLASGR